MSERTSIKSNKTDRPNKTKVKNNPIISESTLKRKTDKTSEKNKNKVAVEAGGSIKELNSDTDKSSHNSWKATEISIPNEDKKINLKSISVPEKNKNKYQAEAVEKEGSKKKQKIGCRTKAIFTNEQTQKNLSSGDSITGTFESKKDFTKGKIPKIKGETKEKSLKLENKQKIFKLEDDKRVLLVKEKFSKNKSTKRSAYEKCENSNSSIPADKTDEESSEKISEPTEERKLNFDKEINQTDFDGDTKDTLTKIMTQSPDLEYEVYTNHSTEKYHMTSILNGVPESNKIKLEINDDLTVDEMKKRINFLLAITAIVQILITFPLIIAIITSLPRIPTIYQPRIPVEAKRTSKLKRA